MAGEEEKAVKEATRRAVQRSLKESGATLRQLAAHWGMSESTLSRINNGKLPSASTALKIHLAVEKNLFSANAERERRMNPARSIAKILKAVAARDRFKVLAEATSMVA